MVERELRLSQVVVSFHIRREEIDGLEAIVDTTIPCLYLYPAEGAVGENVRIRRIFQNAYRGLQLARCRGYEIDGAYALVYKASAPL